jgi:hypothetical protein
MSYLAQQGNRLEPTETFLDPFPLPLADAVPDMSHGPLVEGTAAAPTVILRDMRRDLHVAVPGDEVGRVIRFVSAHRHPLAAGNLFPASAALYRAQPSHGFRTAFSRARPREIGFYSSV